MESGVVVSVRVKPLDAAPATQGGASAAAPGSSGEPAAVSNPRTPGCIFVSKSGSSAAPSSLDASAVAASTSSEGKMFTFDYVHWSTGREDLDGGDFASQEIVFNDIGVPIVDNAIGGYNCTLFAYGQTGSGKTYTMLGPDSLSRTTYMEGGASPTVAGAISAASTYDVNDSEAGLIPRICRDLMDGSRVPVSSEYESTSRFDVTYVEIYMERVKDLLVPSGTGSSNAGHGHAKHAATAAAAAGLRIREHPTRGSFVEGARCERVETYDELLALMNHGSNLRRTASTSMNEHSSRSHAIFTITMTQERRLAEENRYDVVSKINLVDLAGSESARLAGTTGERLKEGAAINKSLLTLGRVIKALADRSKRLHAAEGGRRTSVIGFVGEINSGQISSARKSAGDAVNRTNSTSSVKPVRRSSVSATPSGAGKEDVSMQAAGGLAPPYRDSALTYLLKDSLGGNSKTTLIATIRPGLSFLEESLVTLAYASQARKIVNSVKINENPFVTTIKSLQKQVEELTRNLAMANTIIATQHPTSAPSSPATTTEAELSGPQYMSPFLMEDDKEESSGEARHPVADVQKDNGDLIPPLSINDFDDKTTEEDTSGAAKDPDGDGVEEGAQDEDSKSVEQEGDLFAPKSSAKLGAWNEIFKDVSSFSEHELYYPDGRLQDSAKTALDDTFPEEEETKTQDLTTGETNSSAAEELETVQKQVHKAGFLFKRGWVNTAFKLRWCVTKGDSIYYYKRTCDAKPRGKICCLDARIDLSSKDALNPETPFAFSLQTPYDPRHQSWVLQAPSTEERDDWICVIRAISVLLPPPGSSYHIRLASVPGEAPSSPSPSSSAARGALTPISSPRAKFAVAASVCTIS